MAEDQGKEGEKFDFTTEGEAMGYISLEQAGVLAMRTARKIPGEYASSYQGVPMDFDKLKLESIHMSALGEVIYAQTHWCQRARSGTSQSLLRHLDASPGA
jgi:hypothetical protein